MIRILIAIITRSGNPTEMKPIMMDKELHWIAFLCLFLVFYCPTGNSFSTHQQQSKQFRIIDDLYLANHDQKDSNDNNNAKVMEKGSLLFPKPVERKGYEKAESKASDNEGCIDRNISFFRSFDEAVNVITMGARANNPYKNACECIDDTFIFCNCSHLELTAVPINLRKDVEGLDLSHNLISQLHNSPFKVYSKLKYVSLQHNNLTRLEIDSFQGLEHLQALDLYHNQLVMNEGTFPRGVFRNLSDLVAFQFNRNTRYPEQSGLFYPDQALADLKSLRFLSMDGLTNKTFDKGFGNLTTLETLSLSGYNTGYCELRCLSKNSFKYLESLKMLDISDCGLDGDCFDLQALSPLQNLQTLYLNWNQFLSFKTLTKVIKPLNQSGNLKELFIGRIEHQYQPGVMIKKSYVQSLPSSLLCLVANGNSINDVENGVLSELPKSIKYLDFSGNKMVFGNYLKNLTVLTNLKFLKLNGREYLFRVPIMYPRQENEDNFRHPENGVDRYHVDKQQQDMILFLPPNLKRLTMKYAGLWYIMTTLHVNESNTLEELDISFNYFPSLKGPFTGLRRLKKLVMLSCRIEFMHNTFFEHFPALEYLDLSGNLIGGVNSLSLSRQPFKHLKSLDILNMTFNNIFNMKPDSFTGLAMLRELHLGENPFFVFNASISHMNDLRILNLTKTSIHFLFSETRKNLDKLAPKGVKLYLSQVPLYCDCGNVGFLNWLLRTKTVSDETEYTCAARDPYDTTMNRERFEEKVKIIRGECASNYGIFLAVLGSTLLLLIIVIGSIAYRFRWRLRYFYYAIHLWVANGNNRMEDKQFDFDVFISYSSHDIDFVMAKVCPELERRGLTYCIHSRDFEAGQHVVTNIIHAVKNSKRTLIVLTKNFTESKWCRAEFQMAKEESVVTGRKILVFIIAEKISKNQLGLELLTHIQANTYIPYCGNIKEITNRRGSVEEVQAPNSALEAAMWEKLVRDISSS